MLKNNLLVSARNIPKRCPKLQTVGILTQKVAFQSRYLPFSLFSQTRESKKDADNEGIFLGLMYLLIFGARPAWFLLGFLMPQARPARPAEKVAGLGAFPTLMTVNLLVVFFLLCFLLFARRAGFWQF